MFNGSVTFQDLPVLADLIMWDGKSVTASFAHLAPTQYFCCTLSCFAAVCADGFGVSITGAVNVTRGKKTRSMSLFDCKACGTNEVALTKASGLKPVLDDGTKQWSLKLRSKLKAEDKKRKSLNTKKADVGKEGKKQWGSPDKYAGSPYVRGACVPCPAGTKKSGAACGELLWHSVAACFLWPSTAASEHLTEFVPCCYICCSLLHSSLLHVCLHNRSHQCGIAPRSPAANLVSGSWGSSRSIQQQ